MSNISQAAEQHGTQDQHHPKSYLHVWSSGYSYLLILKCSESNSSRWTVHDWITEWTFWSSYTHQIWLFLVMFYSEVLTDKAIILTSYPKAKEDVSICFFGVSFLFFFLVQTKSCCRNWIDLSSVCTCKRRLVCSSSWAWNQKQKRWKKRKKKEKKNCTDPPPENTLQSTCTSCALTIS